LYINFPNYHFCSDYRALFTLCQNITSSHVQLEKLKKNLAFLCRPTRSKSETNRDSLVHVFPRFSSATRVYFKLRLVLRMSVSFLTA